MDYSLPGSSVHGIFLAGVLEYIVIAFSELQTGSTQMFNNRLDKLIYMISSIVCVCVCVRACMHAQLLDHV